MCNRELAEQVGCSERTVRRALQRGGPPPRRRSGVRPSKLDLYKSQVDRLLAEWVWNTTVIFAEIQAMGYCGRISLLRGYIRPKNLRSLTFRKIRHTPLLFRLKILRILRTSPVRCLAFFPANAARPSCRWALHSRACDFLLSVALKATTTSASWICRAFCNLPLRMNLLSWPSDFDLARYASDGHFGISHRRKFRLRFRIDKACGLHLLESSLAADQSTCNLHRGRNRIAAALVVRVGRQPKWYGNDSVSNLALYSSGMNFKTNRRQGKPC